ncbi:MAG: metallophosphoesterase [Deltaproteobacteria bacterium]|nr:metallophosphoesterase [Deltaproteobacteria bacterium]
MKIGVISDTHVLQPIPWLEYIVKAHFNDVDAIFHTGDFVGLEAFNLFDGKKVYAVSGNMDTEEVKKALPTRLVVDVAGKRFGLIHGLGGPQTVERQLLEEFLGAGIDCLVFGHTHCPFNGIVDDVLCFNPGSPTDRRYAPFNSVGLLHVDDTIKGEIRIVDERRWHGSPVRT